MLPGVGEMPPWVLLHKQVRYKPLLHILVGQVSLSLLLSLGQSDVRHHRRDSCQAIKMVSI